MTNNCAWPCAATVLINPTKAMRENMIEADQIYAGKWCGSVLLSKISEDLSGTGEDKSRSHGRQAMYTYIAKTSDHSPLSD